MHQQPGDRSCTNEAIGGDHFGPVQVYMAAVDDATSAVGADASWFKIFADTWAANPSATNGDGDYWGTNDLNSCCGLMSVKIPEDIAPGDYLLRGEALALHSAGSTGGGQFYMTCFQLKVTGSGTAVPEGVSLPGAYAASDPGILINIHATMTEYTAPGPTGALQSMSFHSLFFSLLISSCCILFHLADIIRDSVLGWFNEERWRSMRGV